MLGAGYVNLWSSTLSEVYMTTAVVDWRDSDVCPLDVEVQKLSGGRTEYHLEHMWANMNNTPKNPLRTVLHSVREPRDMVRKTILEARMQVS